jgi:glycosyltransferase involved in cell wall biosynthesis
VAVPEGVAARRRARLRAGQRHDPIDDGVIDAETIDRVPVDREPADRDAIGTVVVAIPARNEQDRLGACLDSVDRAAQRWGGRVLTVVGADNCTDATASIARGFVGKATTVHTVEGVWRRPSSVRRAIVGHVCDELGPAAMRRLWIANTDADCAVPVDWISRQVALADDGVDVVAGIVKLDPSDTPVHLLAAFTAHYQQREGAARGHVHAANLGLRGSTYRGVGGWRTSTAIGEEHHLVNAAVRRDATISWADDLVVRTSGRTTSRVRGGFATVLDRLQRESAAVADSA